MKKIETGTRKTRLKESCAKSDRIAQKISIDTISVMRLAVAARNLEMIALTKTRMLIK